MSGGTAAEQQQLTLLSFLPFFHAQSNHKKKKTEEEDRRRRRTKKKKEHVCQDYSRRVTEGSFTKEPEGHFLFPASTTLHRPLSISLSLSLSLCASLLGIVVRFGHFSLSPLSLSPTFHASPHRWPARLALATHRAIPHFTSPTLRPSIWTTRKRPR